MAGDIFLNSLRPASLFQMRVVGPVFNVTNMADLSSFHEVTEDKIRKEISKLDDSETIPVVDIPAEMLRSTVDIQVYLLTKIMNSSLRNGCFRDKLKAAEITPIFMKNDNLDKESYRSVSCVKCL